MVIVGKCCAPLSRAGTGQDLTPGAGSVSGEYEPVSTAAAWQRLVALPLLRKAAVQLLSWAPPPLAQGLRVLGGARAHF